MKRIILAGILATSVVLVQAQTQVIVPMSTSSDAIIKQVCVGGRLFVVATKVGGGGVAANAGIAITQVMDSRGLAMIHPAQAVLCQGGKK